MAAAAPLLFREWRKQKPIPGEIKGANSKLGHRLRQGGFPSAVGEPTLVDIAIVGGGVAGLSAAWRLKRKGVSDFLLFELDDQTGGNAAGGENEVSAYPWGAHYIPIAGEDSHTLRELFEESGVITGKDKAGRPIYNEYYLCHDPQERLFFQNRWSDSLTPHAGVPAAEQEQFDDFFKAMASFRHKKGSDGRFLFNIPIDLSSADQEVRKLDLISMKDYLLKNGWDSPFLNWYVNYCCRDDYGATHDQVSAWAGVHYFASRGGTAANADAFSVVTWPEGNGWMTRYLREQVKDATRTGALVWNIEDLGERTAVDVFDPIKNETRRYLAKQVIVAAPRFVAHRLLKSTRDQAPSKSFEYAPWMIGNVTLKIPREHFPGAKPSWDNVSFHSRGLGYVDATHQKVERYHSKSVWTYYWPLTHAAPAQARADALTRNHQSWTADIVHELEDMHPGVRENIERVDIWIWGHGMIIPRPGFIWGRDRAESLNPQGRVHFAHSDMSGISIFEEAQYRGVKAADATIAVLRGRA